ncbi:MAG TPA: DNA replication and repair protein RecF, partial [Kiloniellaceae bacterium]
AWLREGPALAAEDRLRDGLAQSRRQDAESGGAALGPHRSDLLVHHATKGIAAELCSTGEQKALLIAILLAHARLLTLERVAAPVLLLDEVAAHLDTARRAALYEEILGLGAQAWLTGTDATDFEGLEGQAQFFTVRDGTVHAGERPF